MANQTIVDYISVELAKGVSNEAIRQELKNKNWDTKDVDEAFGVVVSASTTDSNTAPTSSNIPSKQSTLAYSFISEFQFYPLWLDRLFRLGFASIFLVNAIVAWREPASFTSLLEQNFIAQHLNHATLMVHIASVNDIILGFLILYGRFRKYIYLWASIWLLLVAGLKLSNLVL